ncbi:MAG: mechanosensitive ion channel protein MscS, partial [Ectothiorhodospiraceae bacterium]
MLSMSLRRVFTALVLVFATLAVAQPVFAQNDDAANSDQAAEEGGTPSARLADILEDDEARAELIRELRREADATEPGETAAEPAGTAASEVMSLPRRVAGFTQSIAEGLVAEFRNLAGLFSGMDVGGAGAGLADLAPAALELLLVIAVTVGAFLGLRRLARPLFARIAGWVAPGGGQPTGILRRTVGVLLAAVVDVVAIVVAWVVGYALGLFVLGDASAMDTRHALFINAFLVIEAFKALLRVVFASRDEALRLLPMDGEEARYWNSWLARLAGLIGYGLMVVVPIVNSDVSAALGRMVAVAIMVSVFLYALVVILKNRQRVRDNIGERARAAENGLVGGALKGIGRVWHLVAIAYFAALSLATLVRPEDALPFMARATVQMLLAIGGGVFISVLLAQMIGRRIRVPEE